jgi:hypothetical protein
VCIRDFYKGERSCPFSLEKLSRLGPASPGAESVAQGVSLPAGSDKGFSPLTSAAFLKNCCTKKLSIYQESNSVPDAAENLHLCLRGDFL